MDDEEIVFVDEEPLNQETKASVNQSFIRSLELKDDEVAFKSKALKHLFTQGFTVKSNKMGTEAENLASEYLKILVVEAVRRSIAVAKSEDDSKNVLGKIFEVKDQENASQNAFTDDTQDFDNAVEDIMFGEPVQSNVNKSVATAHREKNNITVIHPKHFEKIMTQLMMDFH
ncbi:Stra13 [Acrasis kona]|uniref:Stra13 n=1 Tax=Acrasis kona TaxID=1008807 RepID=A0AAW2Z5N1_9EUKA